MLRVALQQWADVAEDVTSFLHANLLNSLAAIIRGLLGLAVNEALSRPHLGFQSKKEMSGVAIFIAVGVLGGVILLLS